MGRGSLCLVRREKCLDPFLDLDSILDLDLDLDLGLDLWDRRVVAGS